MQQVISVSPRNVKIVRLQEVENDPNMFIQASVNQFLLIHIDFQFLITMLV